ncbi:flagellar basal body P-ring formation chaperone FlgA [Aurantimonas sp. Leaf443]|uniref:flagellar basal body P-ring formation chaperone FlgA n=1 Tax=Aurantimonas sp. Leaf443 TaxID=1736378 RepID=UPI0006FE1C6B|nr:flagellar basal body P-ring formation chaperone FlgA [Aurantimonas sp. Leaf443]KQT86015.1 flagellar biosynthesis protein FlgA [Aurantimonas sp. Leaf443]
MVRPKTLARLAAPLLGLAALLQAQAPAGAAELTLPVPTVVIYPGQSILEKGVSTQRFKLPAEKIAAYVVEDGMLIEKLARRTLLPGQPILLSDLRSPDLVRAGVPTPITYSEPGVLIQGLGIPLASAGEGDMVRVRNSDSGITISGIVAADGSIAVLAQ